VFEPNPIEADVVRMMNVLTPNHFPEVDVLRGLEQSVRGLRAGGFLVIGRTLDPPSAETRATIYRLSNGRLEPALSTGGGYEWPDIVSRVRIA
jgi:hypothetical protein